MPEVGQTISHFRLVEKIGSGGMGAVYKAEDTKLGRSVALKFLPEELCRDRQAIERFQREARSASALNHPNICTIHEIDAYEGRHFMAMEYLEGQTLNQRIQEKPFQTDEILDIATQIAEALDAAHSEGIIHRDLKPANIFITKRGYVKILDFGLAKLMLESSGAASKSTAETMEQLITNPGTAVGTVSYMSPEQALGKELDARTDLFSFGVVLYEMATGLLPFRGTTSADTFNAILNKSPTAPVRINPDLPDELERIINKALEKDRDLRCQSASELRADLKRLRRSSDSGHTPIVTTDHTLEKPARRWTLFCTLAVAIIAIVAAGAYFIFSRGKPIDSIAVLPFVNASENPEVDILSEGLTEDLINNFIQLSSLQRVIPRSMVFKYQGMEPDLQIVLVPYFQTSAGIPYYLKRQYDEAIDWFRKALNLEPNFHAAHMFLSWIYLYKNMYEDAIEEIEKAIKFSGPSPQYLGILSLAYSAAGRKSDALKVLEQLKEFEKNRFISSIAFIYAYIGLGDQERAIKYLQKSFESHDTPSLPAFIKEEIFDDIRSDPRIQEIVHKMNIPDK